MRTLIIISIISILYNINCSINKPIEYASLDYNCVVNTIWYGHDPSSYCLDKWFFYNDSITLLQYQYSPQQNNTIIGIRKWIIKIIRKNVEWGPDHDGDTYLVCETSNKMYDYYNNTPITNVATYEKFFIWKLIATQVYVGKINEYEGQDHTAFALNLNPQIQLQSPPF